MNSNITVPPLNGNRNKSNVFLIFLLVFLLLGAIALGLYTVMTQQISTKSRADEVATDSATLVETVTPTPATEVTEPVVEPTADPAAVTTVTPATEALVADNIVASNEAQTATGGGEAEPTVVPTQALVSALSCPANGASCAWDAVSGATGYNVSLVDTTTSDVLIKRTVSSTSVSFTPIINHTYSCSVTAQNDCGVSGLAVAENTCSANVTPTVTPQSTPTPGPSNTPTPGPSATPGPSVTPPSGTVIVRYVSGGPEPTIPTAGSTSTVYFMIIATILAATLFLVF